MKELRVHRVHRVHRCGAKRVLLLATTTGYQTRMFAASAQRLGIELVYATDRCDQLEDPWSDQRHSRSLP